MGGTREAEEMIQEQLENAKRLGLTVDRLPSGEYIVKHESGLSPTGRVYGRASLRDFLKGYEFNEDLQGYIIRGLTWTEPSDE